MSLCVGIVEILLYLFVPLPVECLIVGDETTCNCSVGYVWSNEVCYTSGCCTETTCKKNVSLITPLCVAKTKGNSTDAQHGVVVFVPSSPLMIDYIL